MSSRTNDGVNMKGRGAIDVLPTPVMLLDLDIPGRKHQNVCGKGESLRKSALAHGEDP